MRVLFFLFLFLLTSICKGQLPFDYKKDSLVTPFDVKRFQKYNKDGEHIFSLKDSASVHQLIREKEYIEWVYPKSSNIITCNFFTKKGKIYRKSTLFSRFPNRKGILF